MNFSDLKTYEGPRCAVCLLPVRPAPGQVQRYHKECRALRTRKGLRRFERHVKQLQKKGAFRKLWNALEHPPAPAERAKEE